MAKHKKHGLKNGKSYTVAWHVNLKTLVHLKKKLFLSLFMLVSFKLIKETSQKISKIY